MTPTDPTAWHWRTRTTGVLIDEVRRTAFEDVTMATPMAPPHDSYRAACGMKTSFNLTLRHIGTGARFEARMTTPTLLAGSDRRCPLVLPDKLAAPKELLVQVVNARICAIGLGADDAAERIRRRPIGATGIEVNGFELHAYEETGSTAEVERPMTTADAESSSREPGNYMLIVRSEGRRGMAVPLRKTVTIMGRSPRCPVCLTSAAASYFHAAFVTTAAGAWIVDLCSRTGTFVEEVPVRVKRLQEGARVRIGLTRFEFRVAMRPGAAPRVAGEIMPTANSAAGVADRGPDAARGEVAVLVSSLVRAMEPRPQPTTPPVDAQAIVQALNEMVRMQTLQLGEIRRLNAYLAANPAAASALLEGGHDGSATDQTLSSAPIKPTGKPSALGPESDFHEWFHEGNSEAATGRSVAGLLRRLLGSP